MAKLPDGWVFIPRMKDVLTVEIEQKKLVTCQHCKHCLNEEMIDTGPCLWCELLDQEVERNWFCGYMEEHDAKM